MDCHLPTQICENVADFLSFFILFYFFFFTKQTVIAKSPSSLLWDSPVTHETWHELLKDNFQLPVWLNVLNVYKLNTQKSNFL